ncbi:MAG: exodeoxyribonuclease VII small subunit [Opitutales bacterium]|nr:exodeoxyribonuclease VII small subunit [Opitutales bacterium]
MQADALEEKPFEEALKELEGLVAALETGESPLTELVASYEQGKKLIDLCRARLQDAELRITQLDENQTETQFEADDA